MILICNATGKVGSEVVKALQTHTPSVAFKAASSDLERARQTLGEGVSLILLNYNDAATFAPALEGVDRLFILHPQDRPGRIAQLKAFVDAAAQAGVQRAVVMSALGANRHEHDGMHQLEKYVTASGIATTVLRPNWFMQNFSVNDVRHIKELGEIHAPMGDQKFTFIDTRDIAAVAVKCLLNDGHEGKAYTLMGREALSYPEVAALISQAVGYPITHVSPTVDEEIGRMKQHNAPQEFVDFMAWLYADIHSGYTAQFTPDVEQVLGRPPRSFHDFVREYADVWKKEA